MIHSRKLTNILVFCLFLSLLLFSGCAGQQTGESAIQRVSIADVEILVNGENAKEAATGDEITLVIIWRIWGEPESATYEVLFIVIDPEHPDHIWAEGEDDKQGNGDHAQKSFSITMPDQNLRFAILMVDEDGTTLAETEPTIILNTAHKSREGIVDSGNIINVITYVNGIETSIASPGDKITWTIKWQVWGTPDTSIYTVTFQLVDPEHPDHIWAEGEDDKIGDGSRASKSISTTMPDQDLHFFVVMLDETGQRLAETDSKVITVST